MKTPPGALAATVLLLLTSAAGAADWTKLNRTIVREPAYVSKKPHYCLLVFGREVRTRIWLVADGDFLYVDRNGNGDLTEPGKRVRFSPYRQVGLPTVAEQREADGGTLLVRRLLLLIPVLGLLPTADGSRPRPAQSCRPAPRRGASHRGRRRER